MTFDGPVSVVPRPSPARFWSAAAHLSERGSPDRSAAFDLITEDSPRPPISSLAVRKSPDRSKRFDSITADDPRPPVSGLAGRTSSERPKAFGKPSSEASKPSPVTSWTPVGLADARRSTRSELETDEQTVERLRTTLEFEPSEEEEGATENGLNQRSQQRMTSPLDFLHSRNGRSSFWTMHAGQWGRPGMASTRTGEGSRPSGSSFAV